jgi:tetratricopeptide (TPR) repeat protein
MAGENKNLTLMATTGAALALAALVVSLLIYIALPGKSAGKDEAEAKKLAGELADNNLPAAAIEEYQRLLDDGGLDNTGRASIHYLIGRIYFEEIGDYEKAAASYIRARALDPNGSFMTEAGKNLIACFERIGRRLDAKRELDRQASLTPDTGKTPGKIVARVGGRDITLADLNREMQILPPQMQNDLSTYDKRFQFLQQVIGRDLVYHAALREGYDREQEIQQAVQQLEKEYLIQYYTRHKIAPSLKLDTADLKLYYDAHKGTYENKPFGDVQDKVTQDYLSYAGQKLFGEHIKSLMEAEQVQIFEENLK